MQQETNFCIYEKNLFSFFGTDRCTRSESWVSAPIRFRSDFMLFNVENLKYNVENPFSNNDLLLFCSLSAAQEDLQGNSPAAPRGGVVSAAWHSQNEGGEERLLWGTRPRFEASERVLKSRSCSVDVFLGLIFLSYPRILIMSNKLIKWFSFSGVKYDVLAAKMCQRFIFPDVYWNLSAGTPEVLTIIFTFSCFVSDQYVSVSVLILLVFPGSSAETKGQSQRTLRRRPPDWLGRESYLQGPHHVHASLRRQVRISRTHVYVLMERQMLNLLRGLKVLSQELTSK